MRLRTKILSGFMILTAMLFLAGVWSIYELTTVGTSVQKLLDDNYKSINAARMMIEALEREDSGVLLLLSGSWEEGRKTIKSGDASFEEGFEIAKGNITISGEADIIDDIQSTYNRYKNLWARPIVDTNKQGNLSWYFQDVHSAFLEVKGAVEKLMFLNDQTMYNTASGLKERAHRAVMPGVVAIISALIFTVIFNYFINRFVVSPIVQITEGVQNFLESGKSFRVQVQTRDELVRLVSSIQQLVSKAGTAGTSL